MTTTVTIIRPSQLRELATQLRSHGMETEFRQAIRDAAEVAASAVRAKVRTLQITGDLTTRAGHTLGRGAARTRKRSRAGAHTPLREAVAEVVKIRNDPRGVIIEVDGYAMPKGMQSMPKHLEAKKGWRHPVFGNRNNWVGERGGPWFYSTVRANSNTFHDKLSSAMDEAAHKLAERVASA